jgi:hypothetical protein
MKFLAAAKLAKPNGFDTLTSVSNHRMIKITRMYVLAGLLGLCGSLAGADDKPVPPITFPPRQGTVSDYYPGRAAIPAQIVVLMQDLHANVGVQRNIASMLYKLLHANRVPSLIVCVEGASGEGDVSLLRSLPRGVRQLFEEMLLHRAYLTGAELAATEAAADMAQQQAIWGYRLKSLFAQNTGPGPVTLSPISLWGVDDPDLYRKNWHAAKTVDRQRYEALQYLKNTRQMLLPGADAALQAHLSYLVKLLLLRLQPGEYYDYLKHRNLNPQGPPIYESTLLAAEEYYQMAEARSVAMADNLVKRMGSTRGYTALVTGGFHTQEIASQLKKRGIAYMVVTPDVKVLDQDYAYRARLHEEE